YVLVSGSYTRSPSRNSFTVAGMAVSTERASPSCHFCVKIGRGGLGIGPRNPRAHWEVLLLVLQAARVVVAAVRVRDEEEFSVVAVCLVLQLARLEPDLCGSLDTIHSEVISTEVLVQERFVGRNRHERRSSRTSGVVLAQSEECLNLRVLKDEGLC